MTWLALASACCHAPMRCWEDPARIGLWPCPRCERLRRAYRLPEA